jgi:hypothetical protein
MSFAAYQGEIANSELPVKHGCEYDIWQTSPLFPKESEDLDKCTSPFGGTR